VTFDTELNRQLGFILKKDDRSASELSRLLGHEPNWLARKHRWHIWELRELLYYLDHEKQSLNNPKGRINKMIGLNGISQSSMRLFYDDHMLAPAIFKSVFADVSGIVTLTGISAPHIYRFIRVEGDMSVENVAKMIKATKELKRRVKKRDTEATLVSFYEWLWQKPF